MDLRANATLFSVLIVALAIAAVTADSPTNAALAGGAALAFAFALSIAGYAVWKTSRRK